MIKYTFDVLGIYNIGTKEAIEIAKEVEGLALRAANLKDEFGFAKFLDNVELNGDSLLEMLDAITN